jgi:hypothetical protein
VLPDDAVVIDPPDQSFHKAIARQFITDSGPSSALGLDAIIEGTTNDWWREWNDTLSTIGLLQKWRSYRASAFERHLDEALRKRELKDSSISLAMASLHRQRFGATTPRSGGPTVQARGTDRSHLERMLKAVLSQMSVNELRGLSVPVGLVIDALAAE